MQHKDAELALQSRASAVSMTRRRFVRNSAMLLGSLPATSALGHVPLEVLLSGTNAAHDSPSARIADGKVSLANRAVAAEWQILPSGLQFTQVQDVGRGQTITGLSPAFTLTLASGGQITSSAMRLLGAPKIEELSGQPGAARFAERLPGRAVHAVFEDAQHGLRAIWRAIIRDGSHYVRQEVEFLATKESLPITEITMLDLTVTSAAVSGSVRGSPVRAGSWFFGLEHPLSQSAVESSRLRCMFARELPLEHGRSASYSSVIGVTAAGQLRRDFLRYIERERAHPYRTFLHYNSWYDLGYFTSYDQAGALDVIHAFGKELHVKRGVALSSFLFDDGWDNHKSLWSFNAGFPNGFLPLKAATAKYGAAPGIWLSPWGGYDGPRKERLAYGKERGYEENSGGFVLSGPHYFHRFRQVCLNMMRAYGVNQFKLDGTGNASTVFAGSQFDSDFAAMISLIGDLRSAEPDLYVNLTTGTYPSPFWLRYADSIWRDGDDHSFAGVGSHRQQWITYRDSATYQYVVRRGPLYPLNSLMLHGMIYARYAKNLNDDPQHDFPAEIHSYFGTGTQLQEMYLTHSLLSDSDWNTLAEAARWSRRNADTLVDTHWIGGDPAQRDVYGWASWSPRRGIITLRNPDKAPRTLELDVQSVFELPPDAPQDYAALSPWADGSLAEIRLRAGQPHTFTLQPFEVLTLEATPR